MDDDHYDEAANTFDRLLIKFKEDRRHTTGKRLTDRKIFIGNCVLAQPPEELQFLIATNDASYLNVYSSFSVYFYTKYCAKLIIFRSFFINLYQIQKHLKITRKAITTAIFGAFLLVTPQYQITHSPT